MTPPSGSPSPAVEPGDHAYFFLGNCQMQFLSSVLGTVSSAERYLTGTVYNVNPALEGAPVPYVSSRELRTAARRVNARGGRTILFLQETSHRLFHDRVAGWGDLFSDVLLVPSLGYKALWPTVSLQKPSHEISDREIRRLPDLEKLDYRGKFKRSGVDDPAVVDAFYERSRRKLRFYHPGHPNGEVFADLLETLGPTFAARLPAFEPLVAALRPAMGMYQLSNHPIDPRVADQNDIAWARTDLYRAWRALAHTDPARLRTAVDGADEILRTPQQQPESWPIRAHFLTSVGRANARLGRRRRALTQLRDAAVKLKGFQPVLRRALNEAAAASRYDVIEAMLLQVAPFVVAFTPAAGGIGEDLHKLYADPDGRAALNRLAEQLPPGTWLSTALATLRDEKLS